MSGDRGARKSVCEKRQMLKPTLGERARLWAGSEAHARRRIEGRLAGALDDVKQLGKILKREPCQIRRQPTPRSWRSRSDGRRGEARRVQKGTNRQRRTAETAAGTIDHGRSRAWEDEA